MHLPRIGALTLALALASGSAGLHVLAAPTEAITTDVDMSSCATQPATFSVQTVHGISVVSPVRLVVFGNCFEQGASITIWDSRSDVSLTNGWHFLPANSAEQVRYTVPNAVCHHLLEVRVLDVARNSLALGNGKVYGPCQSPPPVLNL